MCQDCFWFCKSITPDQKANISPIESPKKKIPKNILKLLKDLNKFDSFDVVISAKVQKVCKSNAIIDKNFRGSKYRGISKNKKKWQVRIFA